MSECVDESCNGGLADWIADFVSEFEKDRDNRDDEETKGYR